MLRNLNVEYIKKLWTLELVVQQGSLKRAAVKANVSASAVSQAIGSLERICGKPLLVRRRGSAAPTEEARALLESVRPAFQIFEDLASPSLIRDVPLMSSLDFGTYESIAIDVLPRLVSRLRQLLPALRMSVRISRTGQLLTMIRKGELCAALITEVDTLDRFYRVQVGEDRLGFYGAPGTDWSSIEKLGLGVLCPGPQGYPRYMSRFLKQASHARVVLRSDSFETLRACAAAGLMPCVLPTRVACRADDLTEIMAPARRPLVTGKHGLFLVSQSSCDREEVDFLSTEIIGILK